MNGYITLDYELGMGFFSGTPEKFLIEPMSHLTAMVDKYGVKTNLFVDATYLLQQRKKKGQYPQIQKDWETVTINIKLFGNKAVRASIEESENIEKVYKYSITHYQGNDFVIIGHPKNIYPFLLLY